MRQFTTINLYYENTIDLFIGAELPRILESCHSNMTAFFFVRYQDQVGKHLRLRVKFNDRAALGKLISCLDQTIDSGKYNLLQHKTEKYEPEILRYGGTVLLKKIEIFFEVHSRIVISLFAKGNLDILTTAFICNLLALKIFCRGIDDIVLMAKIAFDLWKGIALQRLNEEDLLALYGRKRVEQQTTLNSIINYVMESSTYSESWINRLSGATKCIEKTISSSPLENNIRITYNNYYSSPKLGLVDSLIHMNNNRLGLNNMDESYIYYLIYASLTDGRERDKN